MVAVGVFVLSFVFILTYSIIKFTNIFIEAPKLRQALFELGDAFFNQISPYSIVNKIYFIPVFVKETAGISRTNEPVEIFLNLDDDCNKIASNSSIRIYMNENELPIIFEDQVYCEFNYLKNSTISFPINISASSTKKLKIFFHRYSTSELPPNFTMNTSSWIPNDGDSYTESLTSWQVIQGSGTLSLSTKRKYGNYGIQFDGSFSNSEIKFEYNPSSLITGIDNGWYLRFWLYLNDTSSLDNFTVYLYDGRDLIYNEFLSEIQPNKWYLFEKEISSSNWQSWTNFDASNGIDFIRFSASNSSVADEKIIVDGLRFELKPLQVIVYPKKEQTMIFFYNLNYLRNQSYEDIKNELRFPFRIKVGVLE